MAASHRVQISGTPTHTLCNPRTLQARHFQLLWTTCGVGSLWIRRVRLGFVRVTRHRVRLGTDKGHLARLGSIVPRRFCFLQRSNCKHQHGTCSQQSHPIPSTLFVRAATNSRHRSVILPCVMTGHISEMLPGLLGSHKCECVFYGKERPRGRRNTWLEKLLESWQKQ
jgi:hypothetical protein